MSRVQRIMDRLIANGVDRAILGGVCKTAVDVVGGEGAGLALFNSSHGAPLCAYGRLGAVGEELQFTLGEGPCRDAFTGDAVVESSDLRSETRWPMFAAGMIKEGALSVASFPVRIGAARLGALSSYRDMPGELTSDQAVDGYLLAQTAAHVIVAAQADVGVDELIQEIEAGFGRMQPIHQATGMMMGQLGIGAEEAMVRLRSAAFAAGRETVEVARDLVAGRLQLENEKVTKRPFPNS